LPRASPRVEHLGEAALELALALALALALVLLQPESFIDVSAIKLLPALEEASTIAASAISLWAEAPRRELTPMT
jgi:hypothetical protein